MMHHYSDLGGAFDWLIEANFPGSGLLLVTSIEGTHLLRVPKVSIKWRFINFVSLVKEKQKQQGKSETMRDQGCLR